MTTPSGNTSTEQIDEHDICSLQDVIDSEKERNEIATAVLGASDSTNCSYNNGYIYRQALYGCATCFKDTNELHGICLACSYACHANHDLYELYTKRNFRCDCGNSKFASSMQCKLQANKVDTNSLNKYNHNFRGLYCVCDRPYPDNEALDSSKTDAEEDEMVQCTVCEDWLHMSHLAGNEAFKNTGDEFDEMICQNCMNDNSYLWFYQGYVSVKLECKDGDSAENVDVTSVELNKESEFSDSDACFLAKMKVQFKGLTIPSSQACYLLNGWRDALCKCEKCAKMYEEHDVVFLTNNEDTIKFYEEKGKMEEEKSQAGDEKRVNEELNKLNRVSQVEYFQNFNSFKQELKDFLGDFASKGEVVKRENVTQFFEELNQRKRQKLDDQKMVLKYY